MSHNHVIGPKRRGPAVDPELKCIICGKSQKNNLKKGIVAKCEASNSPGGLCCTTCFAKIPKATPKNCEEWLKATLVGSICEICSGKTDSIMTCLLCEKYTCVTCLAPESFESYGISSGFPLCENCLPQKARSSPNGEISRFHNGIEHTWCVMCQEFHPVIDIKPMCPLDDTSKPKIIKLLEEDPDHFFHSTPILVKKTKSEASPGPKFVSQGSSEIAAAIITMTKAIADNSAQISQILSLQKETDLKNNLNAAYQKQARGEYSVRDVATEFDEVVAAEAEELHIPRRVAEQKMSDQINELKNLVLSLKNREFNQNYNSQNKNNQKTNNSTSPANAFHKRRQNQRNKNNKKKESNNSSDQ